jgi:hypothetical protein
LTNLLRLRMNCSRPTLPRDGPLVLPNTGANGGSNGRRGLDLRLSSPSAVLCTCFEAGQVGADG